VMSFAKSVVIPALIALGAYIVGTLVPGIISLAGWLKENSAWLVPIAVGVGAIVVAMKAWGVATEIWSGITKAAAVVQGIFNAVMNANPISLVILAIVGLAAGLIYAYKTSETFRNVVDTVFNGIKVIIGNVISVVITIIRGLLTAWTTVIGGILAAAATIAEKLHLPFAGAMRQASDSFNGMAKNADDKLRGIAASASTWGDATGKNYAAGVGGQGGPAQAMAASVAGKVKYGLTLDAYPLGQSVGSGFVAGMASYMGPVMRAATNLAGSANAAMAAKLKAHSPSLVGVDLGQNLGQGLVIGMDSQRGAVAASAASLLSLPKVGGLSLSTHTLSPATAIGGTGSGVGGGGADVVGAIKALGDRFGSELDRQARTIQTMKRQMAGGVA